MLIVSHRMPESFWLTFWRVLESKKRLKFSCRTCLFDFHNVTPRLNLLNRAFSSFRLFSWSCATLLSVKQSKFELMCVLEIGIISRHRKIRFWKNWSRRTPSCEKWEFWWESLFGTKNKSISFLFLNFLTPDPEGKVEERVAGRQQRDQHCSWSSKESGPHCWA